MKIRLNTIATISQAAYRKGGMIYHQHVSYRLCRLTHGNYSVVRASIWALPEMYVDTNKPALIEMQRTSDLI